MFKENTAIFALEDGSVFRGVAFGASKTIVGEAVFNTSMTGYQEILTDPSYYAQIVTMTAPHIGNYGTNPDDEESDGPKVAGFIVRELSPIISNWRSTQSLSDYLAAHDIPGIEGIDTRTITKKLRVDGAMKSCLSTEAISDEEAVKRAREWPGLAGVDYVKEVTCKAPYEFDMDAEQCQPFSVEGTNINPKINNQTQYHIAAIDFGAKRSIFKRLKHYGFKITIFPADTSAQAIHDINPDGLFLSNGPGDPGALDYAHKTVAELIQHYPTFGICLGHQIITHALGAKTFKLKFGHRGGNLPVKNLESGLVAITAQNHGFGATPEELEANQAVVTEINLNDNTVAGLRHKTLPVFSVQYHPEAAPGPNDAVSFFQRFHDLIKQEQSLSSSK